MTYRDNVEQAAVALKRGEDANWELARLTHESTYMSGDYALQPERVSMEQWVADIRDVSGRRFSAGTGRRYKAIWGKYGSLTDSERGSWFDVFCEAAGLSVDETVSDRLASYDVRRLDTASPEKKRETFQRLAADPDVIEEAAMLGTPTSRAVSDLYTKTERVREEFRERETESSPIAKRLDEVGAALDIEAACTRFGRDCERFAREVSEILPRTGAAREEHLYWVRSARDRAIAVLGQLETYVETGRTDLDAFLETVLGGR